MGGFGGLSMYFSIYIWDFSIMVDGCITFQSHSGYVWIEGFDGDGGLTFLF